MKETARVAIVGGGIMGVSLLYHLAREGWRDSVLLEKGELTSGSTWHAAGQITHSTSHYVLGRMAGYAISLYRRLEADTGQSVGWHGCGSLRLAYTKDELDWLKHTLGVGAALGHPMALIGPAAIRELHPFYNLEGVIAALHTPEDGHLDPAGATFALAKAARDLGARIVRRRRVVGIEATPSGEWRVRTAEGDIVCEHVVNAGGVYARQIGAFVGHDLPSANLTHHYLVTESVPEFAALERELPVVRDDRHVSGYIRMEQRSALIGIYEKHNPNTVWDDGAPWDAEHPLFEPDYERIMPWLEAALERMPVLAERGIRRAVHGAITHPPDGNMLLGPAPGLRNVWCCCGSQIGIAWAPGAGRALALWMVQGAADLNMRELDPRRYGPFADRRYQIVKAKEDYCLRHEVPFPNLNRPEGRPVKPSALHERLAAHGAVFEEAYGWERPRWFAGGGVERRDVHSFRRTVWFERVAAECLAVRDRVGVMDLSAFAKIDVSGAGAHAFVERLVANRAPRAVGRIVLAHLANEAGRIEAETTLARIAEDRFYFVCAAFFEQRVVDWLTRHRRPGERVHIENLSSRFGALALQGPRAREVLGQVCAAPLEDETFPWLAARPMEVAGVATRALRLSYTGELGYELHLPMAGLGEVYDALWAAGEPFGIADYGAYAMNAMRLEKAFKGAAELTNEVTLPEADVMRFVRLDKDFVGRRATVASLESPLRWRCAYLEIDAADADPHGGEAVFAGERVVGSVSSGAYGHRVGRSLAFAYLDPGSASPGTPLEVTILGERRRARVLDEAAYDPESRRPRGDR